VNGDGSERHETARSLPSPFTSQRLAAVGGDPIRVSASRGLPSFFFTSS
jgi:hypothetical protein